MKTLIALALSTVFAAGCASISQNSQLQDPANPAPDALLPIKESNVKLEPPFAHFSSVIQVRPFAPQKDDERRQLIAVESVIGTGPDGKSWGCNSIASGQKILTPSEYERRKGPTTDPEVPFLQGIGCVPVEADLSPLKSQGGQQAPMEAPKISL